MTTPCEVHLFSDSRLKADSVAEKILKTSKELELKYNFYNPNSYLSKINRREVKKVDPQTKEILKEAREFYYKTNGIFDITMGTLKGVERSKSIKELEEKREKLLEFVGVEHFKIQKGKIEFDNPYTKIDLGGFVKEYAVDSAVKIVKRARIESALINFGGDIFSFGREFLIGIKNPKNPKENILTIPLKNRALTTSASYERYTKIEQEIYSHIIYKNKVQSKIISATVISDSAIKSGVYSTSLMINPNLDIDLEKILIDEELKVLN